MVTIIRTNDERFKYIKEKLISQGVEVDELSFDTNILILPIQGVDNQGNIRDTNINIVDILRDYNIKKIFVGLKNEFLEKVCKVYKIELISYILNDQVALENAYPTSEGVIKLIVENTKTMIKDSKILVLGFGKCGQVISKQLSALGSNVFVYARNEKDKLNIMINGYQNHDLDSFKNIEIVINTIPTLIINKKMIDNLNKETLIIDIASRPGGTEFEYAKKMGLKTLFELGIPGKIAPKSSGYIIANYIIENLGV